MSREEYESEAAEAMGEFMRGILTDPSSTAVLTKKAFASAMHSEIDVSLIDGNTMQARAVIDLDAETRVPLEKTKLTQSVRKVYPDARIEKRQIDHLDSEEPGELVAPEPA